MAVRSKCSARSARVYLKGWMPRLTGAHEVKSMLRLFSRRKSLESLAKPLSKRDLRKRTKIVVIDDDEHAFPTNALVDGGYTVEHWPQLKSLDRLQQGDFDIIVLDIAGVAAHFSPEDDGFGILQHLKAHNPSQIIVAFSGQSFDLSKQRFFKLADDTMPKPVTPLKCMEVLDQLIESRMTVKHLWETVVALLRSADVPEKKIKQLENQIAAAVSAGGKADYRTIVSGVIEKSDLAAKAAAVVIKIGALFG